MRAILKISWLLIMVLISVGLFAGYAEADVLYHELFAGDGTSTSSHYGWDYYCNYVPSGVIYNEDGKDFWGRTHGVWDVDSIGSSGGIDKGTGSLNSNPKVTDANGNGYVYYGGGYNDNNLFYTNEHIINMANWTDFVISFYYYNDNSDAVYRAALGIASSPVGAPKWYVSDVNTTATGSGSWSNDPLVINTTNSAWRELDTETITDGNLAALPEGYIVAFGLQTEGQQGAERWDNFKIEATSRSTASDVIYHELFAGDGNDTAAHVGWDYYVEWAVNNIYTEDGNDAWGNSYGTWAIGNVGTSGGSDKGIGSVNSDPCVTDDNNNGVYYSGGGYMNSLTYTAEHEVDMNNFEDLVISFDHYNSAGGTPYRAALAIAPDTNTNPTWYLSDPPVSVTATGWNEPRVVIDTEDANGWYVLDLNTIDIGNAATLPASGYVRGFGIQHVGQSVNSQRYDNFMVEAVTETQPPLSVKLLSNTVIWDNNAPSHRPHNAFTDMEYFKGDMYVAFREANDHMWPSSPGQQGGNIRVIRSQDGGNTWSSAAVLEYDEEADWDIRDAALSITPDNKLMVNSAIVDYNGSDPTHSLVWFSSDGNDFGEPNDNINDDYQWLWKVVWRDSNDTAWSIAYGEYQTRLYSSPDGNDWTNVVSTLLSANNPSEAHMVFLEETDYNTAVALVRHNGPAKIGVSSGALTSWDWTSIDEKVGGQELIQLEDGRIVAATRLYNPVRTALCWLDHKAGTLTEFFGFPSGGDTSYCGTIWHDNSLWISYYSSHEDPTDEASIYLAKICIKDMAYQEIFCNPDDGNDPNLSYVDWQLHRGTDGRSETATATISSSDGATIILGGSHNSAPDINDSIKGYVYSSNSIGDSALFWTDEYTIDRSTWSDLVITWWMNNADSNEAVRAAVKIGSNWYVSDPNIIAGSGSDVWVIVDDSNWQQLDFTAGTELSLGSSTTLPSGDFTAFGVYCDEMLGAIKLDNYRIEGEIN